MSLHAESERQGALRIIESKYLYHDRGPAAIRVDLLAKRRLRKMENPGPGDVIENDEILTKKREFAVEPWRVGGSRVPHQSALVFFGVMIMMSAPQWI